MRLKPNALTLQALCVIKWKYFSQRHYVEKLFWDCASNIPIFYFLGYHAELFQHQPYFGIGLLAFLAWKWLDMKYQPNCHYSHNHRLGNRNKFYEWPVVEIYLKMLPVYHIFHIYQDIHQNVQMRWLPFPKKKTRKKCVKNRIVHAKIHSIKRGVK